MPRACGNRDENAGCSSHRTYGHVVVAAMAFMAGILHCDACHQSVARPVDPAQLHERTSFQTGAPWDPMLQLPADVAMCYGVGKGPGRADQVMERSWLHRPRHDRRGLGELPGLPVRQVRRQAARRRGAEPTGGATSSRTGETSTICAPARHSAITLRSAVLAAIEAGARPSTWKNRNSGPAPVTARGSSALAHGLRRRLGRALILLPDAQYRASRLKYDLYRQALKQVFDAVRADNKQTGRKSSATWRRIA